MQRIIDNYWQNVMIDAARLAFMHGKISMTEASQLIRSVETPIDVIEPFDIYCSYLFERANEEAEKELNEL
jgi:hypothetical protein